MSSTNRAMQAAKSKAEGYRIGTATHKHIKAFVEGLKYSDKASAVCLKEAIAVSQDFPKWEKGSEAYKALGKQMIMALTNAGMREGSAKGYATHFSNIVRCAQLPKVEYSIGKRKDGTHILKHSTGLAYFEQCGNFTDARHVAAKMARQYGLTNGKGPKNKVKVLDKGAILDLIDKAINAVRVTKGFDKTLLPALQRARAIAHGSTSNVKEATRIKALAAARAKQLKPLRNIPLQKVGTGVNLPVLH